MSHQEKNIAMEKLIRRTLTALVHHCLKAEHFTSVSDILFDQFSKVLEGPDSVDLRDSANLERLNKIIDVFSIPGTVRRGACLTRTSHLFAFIYSFN